MTVDDSSSTTRAAEPHPEVQDVLSAASDAKVPPAPAKSVKSAREATNAFFSEFPSEDVDNIQEFENPGPAEPIPVRLYEPADAGPNPILVFFHGGGWMFCNLDTHDNVCAALTNRAECLVLSVDYRLAPEHPFPAALDDGYAAVEWVERFGPDIGADTDRIAVGGDSTGGNLAAAVSLLARERSGPELVHQLLLIPVLNYSFDTESYTENAEGYLLSRAAMQYFWDQYLEREIDGHNPFASPLRAETFADLPATTIMTAGFDPLRDEGLAFADALASDGVPVKRLHYPAMVHGFINRPHMWERADEALTEAAKKVTFCLRNLSLDSQDSRFDSCVTFLTGKHKILNSLLSERVVATVVQEISLGRF